MAFTFSLTLEWLRHRMLAANRIIKKLPADYFIDKYNQSPMHRPLSSAEKKFSTLPYLCNICGFSMAELIIDNGWSIRACSATGFQHILDNPDFDRWQKDNLSGYHKN